jgi:hypothetical protein
MPALGENPPWLVQRELARLPTHAGAPRPQRQGARGARASGAARKKNSAAWPNFRWHRLASLCCRNVPHVAAAFHWRCGPARRAARRGALSQGSTGLDAFWLWPSTRVSARPFALLAETVRGFQHHVALRVAGSDGRCAEKSRLGRGRRGRKARAGRTLRSPLGRRGRATKWAKEGARPSVMVTGRPRQRRRGLSCRQRPTFSP